MPESSDSKDLAMAYEIHRHNKRKKMMSVGKEAMADMASSPDEAKMMHAKAEPEDKDMHESAMAMAKHMYKKMMAKGGEVDGEADLHDNSHESLNMEDDLSFDLGHGGENYSEDDALMDQPMDSNEHGDEDEDPSKMDRMSRMMKKATKR